jgi:rSAM/selenodomain-associated transferase 1
MLVFARPPLEGRVKTRMIPAIGSAGATRLYRRMLLDTLATVRDTPADHRQLWSSEDGDDNALAELAREYGLSLHQQHGDNLGQRMHAALAAALRAADRAVLIGSDCPQIDTAYLQAAFEALEQCPVVIGPARDGGYVLIGLRRPAAGLFDGIPWGSHRVMSSTRQRLRRAGHRWHELPPLRDVDRAEDLAHFPALAALLESAPLEQDPARRVDDRRG